MATGGYVIGSLVIFISPSNRPPVIGNQKTIRVSEVEESEFAYVRDSDASGVYAMASLLASRVLRAILGRPPWSCYELV